MNKITAISLIIVALIVGGIGGYLVERSRAISNMETYKLTIQKQMNDAKKMMTQASPTATPEAIMMAKGTGIVTDAKGMTLYTYDKDTKNMSNCSGACLANWPAFLISGTVQANLPANLGTFKRPDGSMQYTWKGMPLYYYVGDKKAGETNGNGVGGVWHVAK